MTVKSWSVPGTIPLCVQNLRTIHPVLLEHHLYGGCPLHNAPYHNILLDAGDLTDETIYNLSKYVIILGQIFLKSPLRYDELRQTNEHESVVRKYPKYRIPIIDRVHVPAKVHRFTKFKQAHLNIEGPRVVKKNGHQPPVCQGFYKISMGSEQMNVKPPLSSRLVLLLSPMAVPHIKPSAKYCEL